MIPSILTTFYKNLIRFFTWVEYRRIKRKVPNFYLPPTTKQYWNKKNELFKSIHGPKKAYKYEDCPNEEKSAYVDRNKEKFDEDDFDYGNCDWDGEVIEYNDWNLEGDVWRDILPNDEVWAAYWNTQ